MSRTDPTAVIDALDEADRDELLAGSRLIEGRRGAELLREGDLGDVVLLLVSGRVKIVTLAATGQEAVLDVRGPGDLIGEAALRPGAARGASVVALEPVRALAIRAEAFGVVAHRSPTLAGWLLTTVARRVRAAERRQTSLHLTAANGRAADRLLDLAARFGDPGPAGGLEIELPLTRGELASWTGASRESLARALRELRGNGALTIRGRRVTIHDVDELRALAAS